VASPLAVSATTNGSPFATISTGVDHACARTADGNEWCWGSNSSGVLGTGGSPPQSNVPVYNHIPQWLSPAQRIMASPAHACVIASAGGVPYCWGDNTYGEIGDATTTFRPTPATVSGLRNVVGLASGPTQNSFALRGDGTLWAWGHNEVDELGDGSATDRHVPVQVSLGNVTAITTTCALVAGGTVYCWGENQYGQVGDGTTTPRAAPVLVSGLSNIVAIGGSEYTHFAIRGDGTAWAWGSNYLSDLGDGTSTDRHTPVQVVGLGDAVAIDGNGDGTCAVRGDGTVWCWGGGSLTGTGATTNQPLPVQVPGINDAVTVSVGHTQGGVAVCVVRVGGSALCWGDNLWGEAGTGTNESPIYEPTTVVNLSGVINMSTNVMYSVALRADGTLWTWGYDISVGGFYNFNATPKALAFSP
jgi:alpha-tubulin suppressor-like RCC1 family protein